MCYYQISRQTAYIFRRYGEHAGKVRHICPKEYECPNKTKTFEPTFKNISLMPGIGHEEINMIRCVFKLGWRAASMRELVKILNFTTTTRKEQCMKLANNLHKAWAFLMTFLVGKNDELFRSYIEHCLKQTTPPSPKHYLSWAEQLGDAQRRFYHLWFSPPLHVRTPCLNFSKKEHWKIF